MDYILEVENLSKKYKRSDFSLEHVSFGVPYGTIMGFVGENGAGKSTTLGCILNTLSKEGGTIRIFGNEMTDCDTAVREEIGVVFDTASFSEHLNPMQVSKVMAVGTAIVSLNVLNRLIPVFSVRVAVFMTFYFLAFAVSYLLSLCIYLKKEL